MQGEAMRCDANAMMVKCWWLQSIQGPIGTPANEQKDAGCPQARLQVQVQVQEQEQEQKQEQVPVGASARMVDSKKEMWCDVVCGA